MNYKLQSLAFCGQGVDTQMDTDNSICATVSIPTTDVRQQWPDRLTKSTHNLTL